MFSDPSGGDKNIYKSNATMRVVSNNSSTRSDIASCLYVSRVRDYAVSCRELMDDCGVMSAMTATGSGKNKFDFLAETCFLQARDGDGGG